MQVDVALRDCSLAEAELECQVSEVCLLVLPKLTIATPIIFASLIFARLIARKSARTISASSDGQPRLLEGSRGRNPCPVCAHVCNLSSAAAAFSQLMSARSRCSRRVTGAFDLHADIWLSLMSLTPNVKYLVHVVTMPGLKSRIHVMGLASIPVEFFRGSISTRMLYRQRT